MNQEQKEWEKDYYDFYFELNKYAKRELGFIANKNYISSLLAQQREEIIKEKETKNSPCRNCHEDHEGRTICGNGKFGEKLIDISQTINQERENLLNDYSDWLHKKGYIDADYYAEEPKAVEEYLKHLSTKINKK